MSEETKGEITKEFPLGKERYCPRCYFENDWVVLKEHCPHYITALNQCNHDKL
jgi:hypothetical protein